MEFRHNYTIDSMPQTICMPVEFFISNDENKQKRDAEYIALQS